MNLFGGDDQDSGDQATESSFYERRFDYYQAMKLGVNRGFRWLQRPGVLSSNLGLSLLSRSE